VMRTVRRVSAPRFSKDTASVPAALTWSGGSEAAGKGAATGRAVVGGSVGVLRFGIPAGGARVATAAAQADGAGDSGPAAGGRSSERPMRKPANTPATPPRTSPRLRPEP